MKKKVCKFYYHKIVLPYPCCRSENANETNKVSKKTE